MQRRQEKGGAKEWWCSKKHIIRNSCGGKAPRSSSSSATEFLLESNGLRSLMGFLFSIFRARALRTTQRGRVFFPANGVHLSIYLSIYLVD